MRILSVDLTSRRCEALHRPDLAAAFIGGAGAAAALLRERLAEKPVILARGPLTFLFPMATKVAALFVSPLTGELGESYGGMRLGAAMRLSGWEAVTISGATAALCVIEIDGETVRFHDGAPLAGASPAQARRLLNESMTLDEMDSVVSVGPAGEKGVAFACAAIDEVRHFGRLGLGAALGSRGVKAVVVRGERGGGALPGEGKAYRKQYDAILARVTAPDILAGFHGDGTLGNLPVINGLKGLPTRNLQEPSFHDAHRLEPAVFAQRHLHRRLSCAGCPVGCIQAALVDDSLLAYDYETVYALGPLLGIGDSAQVLALLRKVEDLGLDAMTAGAVLAWTAEAVERGIVTEEDAGGRIRLGDPAGMAELLDRLVNPCTELHAGLARSPEETAREWGGEEFMLTLQGVGLAAYFTGYGSVLTQVTGLRHSHLDSRGSSLDRKKALPIDETMRLLMEEEKSRCMRNSLILCLFGSKAWPGDVICRALDALGAPRTEEELRSIGERSYLERVRVKLALGYDFTRLRLPERLFETPAGGALLSREYVEEMNRVFLEELRRLVAPDAAIREDS